jgi:hypothetical protein
MTKITEYRDQITVDVADWQGLADMNARDIAASAHHTAQLARIHAEQERAKALSEIGDAIARFFGFGGSHAAR